jgi:DNA-binding winged helix-turn-helix (wHTH) protein
VDVHVRRLRAKLGPENEKLIGTVRNVGYRFDAPKERHRSRADKTWDDAAATTPPGPPDPAAPAPASPADSAASAPASAPLLDPALGSGPAPAPELDDPTATPSRLEV